MNKNILVVGGNGFIGSNLAKYCCQKGYCVSIYDRVVSNPNEEGIQCIQGDAYNDVELISLVKKFDIVINAVSLISPATQLQTLDNGYSQDIELNIKLMQALLYSDVKYIFISSAGAIYGDTPANELNENTVTHPINFYGSCKLCIESICHVMNNIAGKSKYIAVRISNAFGPGQNYKRGVGFIDAAVKCAITGDILKIYGDGETIRDYIYIDDICYLMEKIIIHSGQEEIFNISTGIGYTQNDIISIIEKQGYKVRKEYIEYRIGDIKKAVICNSLVKSLFNYTPQKIDDSITDFIRYIKTSKI